MKQELIESFLTKTSGYFETEDLIRLTKLLKTTSDEAFTILMRLKSKGKTSISTILCVITAIMFECIWFFVLMTEDHYDKLWYVIMLIVFFILLIVFTALGVVSSVKDQKKSRYQEYSKIAQAYQIKDQKYETRTH